MGSPGAGELEGLQEFSCSKGHRWGGPKGDTSGYQKEGFGMYFEKYFLGLIDTALMFTDV